MFFFKIRILQDYDFTLISSFTLNSLSFKLIDYILIFC
jgi:hypothetical protein